MGRRRTPQAMGAIVNQMTFLRTEDADLNLSRATHLLGQVSTAGEAAVRYRDAVLAHPDLSQRLCAIFGYERAAMWTGYVPSRTDGHGYYNTSPYRQHLCRIVADALTRAGVWKPYDGDRLALIPESRIESPWLETRPTPPTPGLFDDDNRDGHS